jgi:hypothetical protein
MDKFTKFTLIFLSLQLFLCSLIIAHLSYKLGYEQGRASIYREWAQDGSEGKCYVQGGCQDVPAKPKHHK